MTIFEPRAFAKPVYQALTELSSNANNNTERLQEQKNQAIELYTYLATWGLMRLKAEEKALSQDDKSGWPPRARSRRRPRRSRSACWSCGRGR